VGGTAEEPNRHSRSSSKPQPNGSGPQLSHPTIFDLNCVN